MPFKSEAQRGFMYSEHPNMAKEFQAHTPPGAQLPEHAAGGGQPHPAVAALHRFMAELGKVAKGHLSAAAAAPKAPGVEESPAHEKTETAAVESGEPEQHEDGEILDPVADMVRRMAPRHGVPLSLHVPDSKPARASKPPAPKRK